MSKTFIAMVSFAAGVFLAMSWNSRGLIMDAQQISGVTFDANGHAASAVGTDPNAVPVVNPLNPEFASTNIGIKNTSAQPLDGLSCRGCTFDNAGLTYGGGYFDLNDVTISGTTRLQLTGAAANTAALLDLLKGIEVDRPGQSREKLKSIEKTVKAKTPVKNLYFSPPYGRTFIGPGQ